MSALGPGCVKTRNFLNSGGGLTPCSYRDRRIQAILEGKFFRSKFYTEFSHSLGRVRTVALIKCHSQFSLFAKAKIEPQPQENLKNVTDYGVPLHGLAIRVISAHFSGKNPHLLFPLLDPYWLAQGSDALI